VARIVRRLVMTCIVPGAEGITAVDDVRDGVGRGPVGVPIALVVS
jgi:hypothetical protein